MKRILYILLLFYGISNAQIVNIPDVNFKNKLLAASSSNPIAKDQNGNYITIDVNGDGEIQVSETANVYQLEVGDSNIQDLTGIEAFINLTVLNCFFNNLTELDISNNINLTDLLCQNNNLTQLDLSSNTNLTLLSCEYNSLVELDVSNNINLIHLYCQNNALTEIDVSNNINLLFFGFGYNNLIVIDISYIVIFIQL